jgi:hypothetical protein
MVAVITYPERVGKFVLGGPHIGTGGVPVSVLAGDDDAGLVGVLAGRHGGIDRHDDPHQVRDISMDWPARLLDQRAGPKGTGYVVQYLGVELLPAEPGALACSLCCTTSGTPTPAPVRDPLEPADNWAGTCSWSAETYRGTA